MNPMQWLPKLKKWEWLVVLTLVTGYFVLATLNLTRLPIFVDEALYLRWAQIAWHDASWRFISLTDGKQPLYIWFVIPFLKLIQDPLMAGRMASVVAGVGTILGLGYLGWLVKDKRTGFYAMLLAILSPYLFFYYRFGVMESLLVASIIWVSNFSVLLARTRRLDIALLLGMLTGLALLVKSSALFFCILIPAAYLLEVDFKKLWTKQTFTYLLLVSIAWFLALVIYNIQRLSPWMHMIGQKNAFFTVPYDQIFAELGRLTNNWADVWRWQSAYTTAPTVLVAFVGAYMLGRQNRRWLLLILIWLFLPMLGTIAVARLFAPRYIIYVTPYLLLLAAYLLASLKTWDLRLRIFLLIVLLPGYLLIRLITDPISYPYTSVDEGYVNGWAAGNGTRQIADWAVNRVEQIHAPVTIFTEGTFGILPHGLELFADGRVEGLTIRGLYPIDKLPPPEALVSVKTNPETYLIMNNTPTSDQVDGLELIVSYPKREAAYTMRLFRVLPPIN